VHCQERYEGFNAVLWEKGGGCFPFHGFHIHGYIHQRITFTVEPVVDNGSSNSDCYAIGIELSYAEWHFTCKQSSFIDIATLWAMFLGLCVTLFTVTDASYLPSSISVHIQLRTAAGLVQYLPITSISATTAPWPLTLVDRDRHLKQSSRKAIATHWMLRTKTEQI